MSTEIYAIYASYDFQGRSSQSTTLRKLGVMRRHHGLHYHPYPTYSRPDSRFPRHQTMSSQARSLRPTNQAFPADPHCRRCPPPLVPPKRSAYSSRTATAARRFSQNHAMCVDYGSSSRSVCARRAHAYVHRRDSGSLEGCKSGHWR